jgi:biopolymer transport protein ExbD
MEELIVKFAKTRWVLVLLALCMAVTTLAGCTDRVKLPDESDEQQEPEEKVPPRLENNTVAQIPFTTMWYRPTMFDSDGVELTDPYITQSVLAFFNDIEFRGLKEGESGEQIYLEMKESQYILLEGSGTIFVCDNGRVMLTIANAGQYFTDVGAVDAEVLRALCAPYLADAAAQQ